MWVWVWVYSRRRPYATGLTVAGRAISQEEPTDFCRSCLLALSYLLSYLLLRANTISSSASSTSSYDVQTLVVVTIQYTTPLPLPQPPTAPKHRWLERLSQPPGATTRNAADQRPALSRHFAVRRRCAGKHAAAPQPPCSSLLLPASRSHLLSSPHCPSRLNQPLRSFSRSLAPLRRSSQPPSCFHVKWYTLGAMHAGLAIASYLANARIWFGALSWLSSCFLAGGWLRVVVLV